MITPRSIDFSADSFLPTKILALIAELTSTRLKRQRSVPINALKVSCDGSIKMCGSTKHKPHPVLPAERTDVYTLFQLPLKHGSDLRLQR